MTSPQHNCNSISLERRLAAYAMAGGAILATAETANAAVIYSGIQNIPIGVGAVVPLDLDGDLTNDFSFANSGDVSPELDVTALSLNRVVFVSDIIANAAALDGGVTISGSSNFGLGTYKMAEAPFGRWFDVSNKFLGLEFSIAGETHYGWARLSVSDSDDVTATLHDWAYEDVAGAAITTAPEPNSLGLLALGAAGIGRHLANRRRRQKQAAPVRN